ncbi:hypothetical protein ACX9MO_12495 [Pseudooceanicola sp. 502str34]
MVCLDPQGGLSPRQLSRVAGQHSLKREGEDALCRRVERADLHDPRHLLLQQAADRGGIAVLRVLGPDLQLEGDVVQAAGQFRLGPAPQFEQRVEIRLARQRNRFEGSGHPVTGGQNRHRDGGGFRIAGQRLCQTLERLAGGKREIAQDGEGRGVRGTRRRKGEATDEVDLGPAVQRGREQRHVAPDKR